MPFWDGSQWIDEGARPARRNRPAPRAAISRLGDVIATLVMVVVFAGLLVPLTSVQAGGLSLDVSPGSGSAGSTVQVSGTGFQARSRLQITWDGSASGMPTVIVNRVGTFETTVQVPSAAVGPHRFALTNVAPSPGAKEKRSQTEVLPDLVSTEFVLENPTPDPTPGLDPSAPPAPTADPTASPDASLPADPTGAPVATQPANPPASSAPTAVPQPTVTPAPTRSPAPTVTPAPTQPPAPTPTPATAYYVALTGSDAASGSQSAPWRTIGHAAASAPGGATIRVNTGIYAPFTVSRSSITIEPVAGALVTVSGGRSTVVVTGSNITIRGLRITGATSQGIWVDGASTVRLEGLVVEGNLGHGIQIIRATSVSVVGSRISANLKAGLRELDDTSGGRYTGNTITDNGHDGDPYNGDGILLQGSGAVVSGNTILRNGDSPDFEHGIYVASIARNYRIDGNVIKGNGASGIKASGGGSITDNTIAGSPRGFVLADSGPAIQISGNTVDASLWTTFVTSGTDITRFDSDFNAFTFERFGFAGSVLTLAGWRTATGLDVHSS